MTKWLGSPAMNRVLGVGRKRVIAEATIWELGMTVVAIALAVAIIVLQNGTCGR